MFYYVEPIIPWEPEGLGSQRQVASALPFSIHRFKVYNTIAISCVSLLCVPLGICLGSFLDRESLYSFDGCPSSGAALCSPALVI